MVRPNRNPLVSVVIPFYNDERTAEKVVGGFLGQRYSKMEVIAVNDCSPDRLLEKLEKFKNINNFKLIDNKKNLGLVKSLNRGIMASKGEIVVLVLGDCYPIKNTFIEKAVKCFEDPEVITATPLMRYPKELWDKFDPISKEIANDWVGDFDTGLDQKGVAYRKKILEEVGLFDEKRFRNFGEDFDMTMKLKNKGRQALIRDEVIIHDHPSDLQDIVRMWRSYGRAFGILFRIYGLKVHKLKGGISRSIFPLWAVAKFLKSHRNAKNKSGVFKALLKMNYVHATGFIRGFVTKK
jgi:glycosyltransferase involved in cell wall biosynthesis